MRVYIRATSNMATTTLKKMNIVGVQHAMMFFHNVHKWLVLERDWKMLHIMKARGIFKAQNVMTNCCNIKGSPTNHHRSSIQSSTLATIYTNKTIDETFIVYSNVDSKLLYIIDQIEVNAISTIHACLTKLNQCSYVVDQCFLLLDTPWPKLLSNYIFLLSNCFFMMISFKFNLINSQQCFKQKSKESCTSVKRMHKHRKRYASCAIESVRSKACMWLNLQRENVRSKVYMWLNL